MFGSGPLNPHKETQMTQIVQMTQSNCNAAWRHACKFSEAFTDNAANNSLTLGSGSKSTFTDLLTVTL